MRGSGEILEAADNLTDGVDATAFGERGPGNVHHRKAPLAERAQPE
jgi:hypothetical protein